MEKHACHPFFFFTTTTTFLLVPLPTSSFYDRFVFDRISMTRAKSESKAFNRCSCLTRPSPLYREECLSLRKLHEDYYNNEFVSETIDVSLTWCNCGMHDHSILLKLISFTFENRFFRFFSSYVQKKILLSSYRSRKIQRIEITGESYRVLAYCCLNYTIFDIRLVIGGDRNNKRIIRKIITRLNWEIKKYVGFSLGRL